MKFTKDEYFGLGRVPIGIGAVLKGWNITEEHYRNQAKLPIIDFRAMTNACPYDCFHCFTDKNSKTLSLDEIMNVIDQLAERNTYAIDYLGEGEPTLDKEFFKIIEYTSKKGIIPVVFTDAATMMRNRDFVKRTYDAGATVSPKCDSLINEKFQNWVVRDRKRTYFQQRNEAIEILMEEGFNEVEEDGSTRLGFDMVVCKKNKDDVEQTLRYCRENNLWIVFTFYLPAGRSGSEEFNKDLVLTTEEKKQVQETVLKIDEEYRFKHRATNNFITSSCVEVFCIYGDGRFAPCVGNETIIGNVKTESINDLEKKMLQRFPCHDRTRFDGQCVYRERLL